MIEATTALVQHGLGATQSHAANYAAGGARQQAGKNRAGREPNDKSTEENDPEFRPRSERAYSGWARAKLLRPASALTAKTVRLRHFARLA